MRLFTTLTLGLRVVFGSRINHNLNPYKFRIQTRQIRQDIYLVCWYPMSIDNDKILKCPNPRININVHRFIYILWALPSPQ